VTLSYWVERSHRTIGAGLAHNTSQAVGARTYWENRNLFGNAEIVGRFVNILHWTASGTHALDPLFVK